MHNIFFWGGGVVMNTLAHHMGQCNLLLLLVKSSNNLFSYQQTSTGETRRWMGRCWTCWRDPCERLTALTRQVWCTSRSASAWVSHSRRCPSSTWADKTSKPDADSQLLIPENWRLVYTRFGSLRRCGDWHCDFKADYLWVRAIIIIQFWKEVDLVMQRQKDLSFKVSFRNNSFEIF